jgi:hypothetical protein
VGRANLRCPNRPVAARESLLEVSVLADLKIFAEEGTICGVTDRTMPGGGWGTWIRTKIDGVRVRCSTVELFPTGGPGFLHAGSAYFKHEAGAEV